MKILITSLIAIVISGCATTTTDPITSFDMNKLRAIPEDTICQEYYVLMRDGSLSETAQIQIEGVLKEHGVTDENMDRVRRNEISIGMSTCGLFASWGRANYINAYTSANVYLTQHIYTSSWMVRKYVYTRDGAIVSWQI